MRRRLFTILAVVSMVLCMAVVVLWMRADEHREFVLHAGTVARFDFVREHGGLRLDVYRAQPITEQPSIDGYMEQHYELPGVEVGRVYTTDTVAGQWLLWSGNYLHCSYWLMILLLLVPLCLFLLFRTRWRHRRGAARGFDVAGLGPPPAGKAAGK